MDNTPSEATFWTVVAGLAAGGIALLGAAYGILGKRIDEAFEEIQRLRQRAHEFAGQIQKLIARSED